MKEFIENMKKNFPGQKELIKLCVWSYKMGVENGLMAAQETNKSIIESINTMYKESFND